jgi:hypothetical protein
VQRHLVESVGHSIESAGHTVVIESAVRNLESRRHNVEPSVLILLRYNVYCKSMLPKLETFIIKV